MNEKANGGIFMISYPLSPPFVLLSQCLLSDLHNKRSSWNPWGPWKVQCCFCNSLASNFLQVFSSGCVETHPGMVSDTHITPRPFHAHRLKVQNSRCCLKVLPLAPAAQPWHNLQISWVFPGCSMNPIANKKPEIASLAFNMGWKYFYLFKYVLSCASDSSSVNFGILWW